MLNYSSLLVVAVEVLVFNLMLEVVEVEQVDCSIIHLYQFLLENLM